MNKRVLTFCFALVFFLALFPLTLSRSVGASVIRVPVDYPTIQQAIDSAAEGDIIVVDPGIYHENLLIGKSLSLVGVQGNATIVDGSGVGSVVEVAADNVSIDGFTFQNSRRDWGFYGVYLNNCTGCSLSNNLILNNQEAVAVVSGSNNTLAGNTVQGNSGGIRLDSSSGNLLQKNVLVANSNSFGVWGSAASDFLQSIDSSNTVDGRSIYYWVGRQDEELPSDAGYVGLVNSRNITAKGLVLMDNWDGVMLFNTSESRVVSCLVSGNSVGIRVNWPSSDNVIEFNNITDNAWNGVWLFGSSNNTVSLNTFANNSNGGVYVRRDSVNGVDPVGNVIDSNFCESIVLWSARNNTVSSNIVVSDRLSGVSLTDSSGNVIVSNDVAAALGGIELSASGNNTIANNSVTRGGNGVLLYKSFGNVVRDNLVVNNGAGFLLDKCGDNSIFGNDVGNNTYGFNVQVTANNTVFHNNVFSNVLSVFAYDAVDFWDDGYPSGGNYWSDYDGLDVYSGPFQNESGFDWIGDSPYLVGSEPFVKDNYPLVFPFSTKTSETYTVFQLAFRDLFDRYMGLRVDFEALNASYSGLLSAHERLVSEFAGLNASYYQLLSNYGDLLSEFDGLSAIYEEQLSRYSALQGGYMSLQAGFEVLNASYTALSGYVSVLQGDLAVLNSLYLALNATHNSYRAMVEGELSFYRSLVFVVGGLMVVVVVACTFLVVRARRRVEKAHVADELPERSVL